MVKEYLKGFVSLIFPRLCVGCGNTLGKGEEYICFNCLVGMPRTNFHLSPDNPIEKIFWGRVQIERATSWFFYQKGSEYQHILHHLKYKGLRSVGVELGRNFAAEIKDSGYFDGIDVLVPVPLHPKKERQRGYNQSEAIAEGIASIIGIPIENKGLLRNYYSESQTRKGRYERWENVNDLFGLNDDKVFEGKHVLLIDDVVTTGSTIEACARKISECDSSRISVVTMGFAMG